MHLDDLLTPKQAAEHAGVHIRTIRKWVEAGRLQPVHRFPGPTGMKLFRAEDVDRAAANQDEAAS